MGEVEGCDRREEGEGVVGELAELEAREGARVGAQEREVGGRDLGGALLVAVGGHVVVVAVVVVVVAVGVVALGRRRARVAEAHRRERLGVRGQGLSAVGEGRKGGASAVERDEVDGEAQEVVLRQLAERGGLVEGVVLDDD